MNLGTIHCPYCDVHSTITLRDRSEGKLTMFETVQCNHCNELILFIYAKKNNQWELVDQYPKRIPKLHESIPDNVGRDYVEAIKCFDVGANKASVVMCRRALQNSIIEKGAKKDRLVDQIDELYQNQIITKDIKDWAHEIRLTGNIGAHPDEDGLEDVTQKDADELLKFMEEHLNYVYVMPSIVAEKRAKKDLKKTNKSA